MEKNLDQKLISYFLEMIQIVISIKIVKEKIIRIGNGVMTFIIFFEENEKYPTKAICHKIKKFLES